MLLSKKIVSYLLTMIFLLTFSSVVEAGRNLVVIETNLGDITVELYQDKAPLIVENFLGYVDRDFYTDTVFHRVIEDFMAQAGAYDPNLYEIDFSQYSEANEFSMQDPNTYKTPDNPIATEASAKALKNLPYTITMAQNSASLPITSQFFINFEHNDWLDGSYAVFGEVVEGFDVVDAMNGVETIQDPDGNTDTKEYDHITTYFDQDVPVTPIVISRVYRLRTFEDDSSPDFEDVDYLKATEGGIRTYVFQIDEDEVNDTNFDPGDIWSYEFEYEIFNGVNCLKWRLNQGDSELTDKTYYMARDTDGEIYILKEVKDEDTSSEQILFEATNLLNARSISYYSAYIMHFRLIEGTFDPDNISADENKISIGSGSSSENYEIVSLNSSLAPNYTNDDVIVVKTYRGLTGSENNIEFYYYHKENGLILYLQDENQSLNGPGWWLDNKIFNSDSNDFADVPYFNLEKGFDFTRYFVGKGDYTKNFSQSISYPNSKFNGVSYVTWIQNGITEEGIREFEIHMARDTNGEIWVFYYETDLLKLEFDTLLEAVKLDTLANDYVHFALMTGLYDSDDIDSVSNSYSRTENGVTINEKIVAFDESLDHIPHYKNSLCKVKRWEGATEDDNNILYFSKTRGLIRIYRDQETGSSGNGWEAGLYGGLFKTDELKDMSEVDFLKATAGNSRLYYGSNELEDKDITHAFSSINISGLSAFRTVVTENGNSTALYDLQLAKDDMDVLWVLRYKRHGSSIHYVGSGSLAYLSARPLSTYAYQDMYLKLISGEYDSSQPYDPNNADTFVNKIAYTDKDDNSITEQIVDFNADLPGIPYHNNDLILVEYNNLTDPNDSVRWKYYHKDDGLVREIRSVVNEPNDFENTNTYRLAWASKPKPNFGTASSDLSSVPFLNAKPGDTVLMQGQGIYEDNSYLVQYRLANYLGTQCLEIYSDLTEIDNINLEESMIVARNSEDDSLWVMANYQNSDTVFATSYLDQAVPFERWPDLRWQMCVEDQINIGDSVTSGSTTKTLIAKNLTVSQRADLKKNLSLVKHTFDPAGLVDGYTYLGTDNGVVLSLYDNFMDPNENDPNYDDPDMIEYKTADGFYQVQSTALNDLEIRLNASRNRTPDRISDSFRLTGDFDLTADEFLDKSIIFSVGKWSVTIDTNSPAFRKLSNTRYRYRGIVDGRGIVYLLLDLRNNTFLLKANRIDLTGLLEPLKISMVVSGEMYQGNATLIGKMPVYLNKGLYDSLEAYRYTRRWNQSRINDRLTIFGGITAISDYDLSDDEKIESIKFSWDSANQTIAVDSIKKFRNRNRYYYRSNSDLVRYFLIDWDTCTFKVLFVKNSLKAPSSTVNLTITITDADKETVYTQSTTVK